MSGPSITGDATLVARVQATLPADALPDDARIVCAVAADRPLLRELDAAPGLLVLVVADLPTPHLIRALWRRCDGIVEADALPDVLAATLAAVRAGQCVYPASFRRHLQQPALSTREKQVLAMVVLGLANIEIAAKLFVAESSVKAHLTSAFGKLGVRSRDEAAAVILDPDAGYGPGILRITEDDGAQR